MMKINITTTRDGYRLKISSPDRDAFFSAIESLKNYIAPYHREYDGAARQWVIDGAADFYSWLDIAEADYAAEVIWGSEKRQQRQHQSTPKSEPPKMIDAYKTLCLTPDAPPELVRVAYRCLAQIHHPDKASGDELKMKRINLAFESLRAA
jgi:DnaJ-domain-containing protein 1